MNKRIACFLFSAVTWAAVCAGFLSARAYAQSDDIISSQEGPGQTCAEARAAEEERHRSELSELQKADIDALKDYNNRLLVCQADRECREDAKKQLNEKRRSIQTQRNEVNAEHAKRRLDDTQRCRTKASQPELKPLQPKLDPRKPSPSSDTTWKDAYGDEYPTSNRHVFTTPDGKQFAFPRTIEIAGDVYDLDTKSFQHHKSSWGGWNTQAYYRNRTNPQDRTSRHGTLVQ